MHPDDDMIYYESEDVEMQHSVFESREQLQQDRIRMEVTSMMLELGIPANIRGYFYLREAIIYKMSDPDISISLTKSLYPGIAKKFNTSSVRVERSIRHAIEVAWGRGDPISRQKFFGSTISRFAWKPTNGEFIATLVDYMKLRADTQ